MKITQENVYQVLDSVSGKGLTVKELLSAMGQKQKRKALLRKTLKKLAAQDYCFKQNNKYFPKKGIPKSTVTRKGRTSSNEARPLYPVGTSKPHGVVMKRKGAKCVFSFQDGHEYPLTVAESRGVMHGDTVQFDTYKAKNGVKMAKLTRCVEKRIGQLKGLIALGKNNEWLFTPLSRYFEGPFKVLKPYPRQAMDGQPVWLEITRFSTGKSLPEGRVVSIGEGTADLDDLYGDILMENRVSTRFSSKALMECDAYPKAVRYDGREERTDLRALPFVTIDGEDAKDFDDAIFAQKEGAGYRLWVSIADVAEYVARHSEVDKDAMIRGTSTYLPGKAYPMLPEVLSNGLCSLKEGVNRKALTCEMLMDGDGRVQESKIYSSMVKIACRLTYPLVDTFFETGIIKPRRSFPDLQERLNLYRDIAHILEKKRRARGAIDFVLPDTQFVYRDGKITDIKKEYQTRAMKLIEQFMLEANETVGLFCATHDIPIIWRNHPKPLPEKRQALNQLFWNNHIQVPGLSSGKDYNRVIKQIEENPRKDFLEYAMLRSMSLALYETERQGHFGLAATHYCHFTSPIRRYPDLQVHRALKTYLSGRKPLRIQESIAVSNSERERAAVTAERRAVKLQKLLFMAGSIGDVFAVRVSGFLNHGVFVEIDHPFVEGYLPLRTIYDDHYDYDERNQRMTGRRLGRRVYIGTGLKVMMTSVDWRNNCPEFDWIGWEKNSD